MSNKRVPKRSEIPVEFTWRLEDIFPTDDAWEQEYQNLKQELPEIQKFQGKLGESADTLLNALKLRDSLSMRLGKLFVYARMRSDEDTTNSFYQALADRAQQLVAEASSRMSFMRPELLAIPQETIEAFLQEKEELQVYRYELEQLNQFRPHVLSAREEALLASASEVLNASRNIYGMLNNADLKFPTIRDENGQEVEITHGRLIDLLENQDRRVRKETFHAVYSTYDKLKNTFASTLSTVVKRNNFLAQARNYESARQRALSENQIPEKVYDQLVETVNKHLPLLYRYLEVRKRVLGLDELHLYDVYVPLVKEVPFQITYEEAKKYILQGLAPLGKEYVSIVQKAFQDRWIDVYENQGKRSGAYSFGAYGTNPYILMNWQDNVDNLFTLAHELGHSVHSYYTRSNQPYVYGDYSIFVAEVASTCNENLLHHYLLQNTKEKEQKFYLLNRYLDGFRATVYRQTMFAEFEQEIHLRAQKGEALTAESLTKLYYDLNKKYFGDGVVVDPDIGLEWARIPHFYYNFYVYQYATGFSAATALSKQILEEGEPAVKRYIEFLKSGSSASPIEILKRAGVDMTSPEPIEEAFKVFEQYLNELEQMV